MRVKRLIATGCVAIGLACAIVGGSGIAQDYPSRTIKVIAPFPAGGPVDLLARALSEGFKERTGQTFVVENKPGGNTIIAANACKSAEPDGYTFCILTASTISLNPSLYANLSYNVERDFAPVTNLVFTQQALLLNPSVPANTLAELIKYAKDNPGKLNFASFGVGGDSHLVFEWLKAKAGIQMTHVPYGGAAPALVALLRNDVQMMYPVATAAMLERIRSGTIKAIAIADGTPNPNLPNVPGFAQAGLPPYDAKTWFGAFAPSRTPKPVVDTLSGHLQAVLKSQAFHDRFVKLGGFDAVGNTPEEFRAFIAADGKRGAELVKLSGVKLTQ